MQSIELIQGSCANQEVDVVVNAANRYLAMGGGICGVIFSKAGDRELTNACRKYNTPLNDGDAVITPSFGIKNAKAIIHAVGPDFGVTPNGKGALLNAYYNSLCVMKENGFHSIAFPLISSGIFGGSLADPVGESTRQCCLAYDKFISDNSDYDVRVILCAFKTSEYDTAKKHSYFESDKPLPGFWDADGAGVVPYIEKN